MKTTSRIILMSLTLGAPAAHAADFSACADYINPETPSYEKGTRGSHDLNPGLENYMPGGFMPFRVEKDGSLDVFKKAIISHKTSSKVGEPEVIEYNVPDPLAFNEPGFQGNPFDRKMRKVKILIYRGADGSMSIKTRYDYKQSELDAMKKKMDKAIAEQMGVPGLGEKTSDDQTIGEKGKASSGQGMIIGGGGMGAFLPKGGDFNFSVQNGKCIPMQIKSSALVDLKKDGDVLTMVHSDTKLCRDIAKEFKKNPELTKCFDADMNKGLTNIFKDYFQREPFITPQSQFDGEKWSFNGGSSRPFFPPNGNFGTTNGGIFGKGLGGLGMGSGMSNNIPGLLLPHMNPFGNGPISAEANQREKELGMGISKYFGVSPTITAAHYLELCKQKGLEKFIEDESYWGKLKSSPLDSKAEGNGDSGAKR